MLDGMKEVLYSIFGAPLLVTTRSFFKLTFMKIGESLWGLEHLIGKLELSNYKQYVCKRLDCPSLTEMKRGLIETMKDLRRTRFI